MAKHQAQRQVAIYIRPKEGVVWGFAGVNPVGVRRRQSTIDSTLTGVVGGLSSADTAPPMASVSLDWYIAATAAAAAPERRLRSTLSEDAADML